jgi:chemotaxis protein MotB
MKQLFPVLFLLATMFFSCVPKEQYQALETERNYYRNQTVLSDSLADQRAISSYDEVDPTGNELDQRIRQIESLTATNTSLNNSYQSLRSRYDELLGQSQQLLSQSGAEVTTLQQSLAERTTTVAQREDELRQLEANLTAREEAIARIEQDYAPAGGGAVQTYGTAVAAPQAYGTNAVASLSTGQNTALQVNEIQNQVSQVMATYPTTAYQLANEGNDKLRITLSESLLTTDGFTVSPSGQQLLRSLANSLRTQAAAEVLVVGHADNGTGNALRAYEDSSDKAINVAQQLINFGMSPRKVTIGAKGFYDPVSNGITQQDLAANRRTELLVTVFAY